MRICIHCRKWYQESFHRNRFPWCSSTSSLLYSPNLFIHAFFFHVYFFVIANIFFFKWIAWNLLSQIPYSVSDSEFHVLVLLPMEGVVGWGGGVASVGVCFLPFHYFRYSVSCKGVSFRLEVVKSVKVSYDQSTCVVQTILFLKIWSHDVSLKKPFAKQNKSGSWNRFSCLKQLACVASVSVLFRSKERPRNEILRFGRARNETRAIFRGVFLRNNKETLATQAINSKMNYFSFCSATGETMNTWNISGMFIVLRPITEKIRTCEQSTKQQTNKGSCLRFSFLTPDRSCCTWLAFFLHDIFTVFSVWL